MQISSEALAALKAHRWPGNIRELDNVLAVAVAVCDENRIELVDLTEHVAAAPTSKAEGPSAVANSDEGTALEAALSSCGWNISEAARRLGVDRSTVHRQIKRHRLRAKH
ncbi:Acetoin catabolism regulatory protein [compost metagenome]